MDNYLDTNNISGMNGIKLLMTVILSYRVRQIVRFRVGKQFLPGHIGRVIMASVL